MSDEGRNIATGVGVIAVITSVLYVAWVLSPLATGQSRMSLVFGVPILSIYGLCTRFGNREPRTAWRNIALALVSAVLTGLAIQTLYDKRLGDTLVSLDAVLACLWGLAWVAWWFVRRRKAVSAVRWPLAVGLIFLISGLLHALLDIGINYGPK